MAEAAGYLEQLTGDVLGIARDYVRTGVRVSLASNLLPEIPVYAGSAQPSGGTGSGASGQTGVADLLGIKAGIVVRNAKGEILARYGNPAPMDPLRAGVLALIVLGVAYVFVRGVASIIR